jgi:hypothetical protein
VEDFQWSIKKRKIARKKNGSEEFNFVGYNAV